MYCSKCGKPVKKNSAFCSHCGAKVNDETITNETINNEEYIVSVIDENEPPKSSKLVKKLSNIGIILGLIGATGFLLIVLFGLIIYGKVYLFHGYAFTSVLTIISIVFMFIGLFSLLLKLIFKYAYINLYAKSSLLKKILSIVLAVSCILLPIWGFIDCSSKPTYNNNNYYDNNDYYNNDYYDYDTIDFYEIYDNCNCSSPWAYVTSSYLEIDSNPYDYDSDSSLSTIYLLDAVYAIEDINYELSLPSYLIDDIGETRAIDGRQYYYGTKVTVSWTYHPDQGIEIIYTKN